jgi:hypothetical protein
MRQYQPSRRALRQRGLLLGVGGWAAALSGCSSPDNAPAAPTPTTTATPTPTRGGGFSASDNTCRHCSTLNKAQLRHTWWILRYRLRARQWPSAVPGRSRTPTQGLLSRKLRIGCRSDRTIADRSRRSSIGFFLARWRARGPGRNSSAASIPTSQVGDRPQLMLNTTAQSSNGRFCQPIALGGMCTPRRRDQTAQMGHPMAP